MILPILLALVRRSVEALLTVKEVAKLLKLEPATIRGYARDPRHPLVGIKLSAGWRFTAEAVATYMGSKVEMVKKVSRVDGTALEAALRGVL
jgi:hypothetical protein